MKLSAMAVVILALGIALALAFRSTVFEAEATKPFPEEGRQYHLAENEDLVRRVDMGFGRVDTTGCNRVALFIEMEPSEDIDRFHLVVGAHGGAWNQLTPDYVAEGSYPGGLTRYQRYDNVVAPLAGVHIRPRSWGWLDSLDLYCLP